MKRRYAQLALAALMALSVGSCGSCMCGGQGPEPPPTPTARKLGWSFKATPRTAPEQADGELVQRDVQAREAPTVSATPGKAELPADFPADIPVPEGSAVEVVTQVPQNGQNVVFSTDEEPPKLFSLYKDDMSGNGWKVTQEHAGKDQAFLSFKKGDTVTNVSISKDPETGKKFIAVMYYEEEQLPFPEF